MLLLSRLRDAGIAFLVCGSTAAYAYGLDVVSKDLDVVVEYQRARWESILRLADEVDPQPSGVSLIREPRSFPAQMHVPLGRGVDVLSGFRHASFRELDPRRQQAVLQADLLEDEQLIVPVVALADLIESWRARGEPRDAALIAAATSLPP